jgi:cell division protein FtsI/penicillin-binding protein 2
MPPQIEERRPPITPQLAVRVAVLGGLAFVLFAVLFFRLWFLQVLTGEDYVTQARENLALAEGRYQVGVGPLIDVTDAELALTQAESENIQAIVDYQLSEVRLRKAMGLLE